MEELDGFSNPVLDQHTLGVARDQAGECRPEVIGEQDHAGRTYKKEPRPTGCGSFELADRTNAPI